MQITDPTIISYRKTSLEVLMNSVSEVDGDCIVAYSLNTDGSCSDEVFILQTDVYSEADDEFLEFEGKMYNWEVEVHSLKSIKNSTDVGFRTLSVQSLVDEAKYYLVNRAYKYASK